VECPLLRRAVFILLPTPWPIGGRVYYTLWNTLREKSRRVERFGIGLASLLANSEGERLLLPEGLAREEFKYAGD